MLEFNFKYFFPNNFFVLFSIVYFVSSIQGAGDEVPWVYCGKQIFYFYFKLQSSIQGAGDEVPWVYCGKQIFYFYFKLQSIVLLQQSMTSEIQITVFKTLQIQFFFINFFVLI